MSFTATREDFFNETLNNIAVLKCYLIPLYMIPPEISKYTRQQNLVGNYLF